MLYLVKDLDNQLSIKIGDFTRDNGDGILFTGPQRLKYLERAYNKTVRLLNISMEKYAPQFTKRHYELKLNVENNQVTFNEGYSKINQIVVIYENEDDQREYKTFVSKLEEESYLATKYKLNEQRQPSFESKIIYYSIINDKINLLPEAIFPYNYKNITILYNKDGIEIDSINDKIALEKGYIDLVLSFAAGEAMVDLGRGDKANAFFDDAYSQIKILQQLALVKKREAGNV